LLRLVRAFLGGLAGELYRQFSVTISIAVVLSGIVALTLTPALCALFLKPEQKIIIRFFYGLTRLSCVLQNTTPTASAFSSRGLYWAFVW
jgi:multidrug efflux pump subunit AcrB